MEIHTSALNNLPVCSICDYNWNTHINFTAPQKKFAELARKASYSQRNDEPKTGILKICRKTSK